MSGQSSVMVAAPLRGSGLQETMSHTMGACSSRPIGSSRALVCPFLRCFRRPLLAFRLVAPFSADHRWQFVKPKSRVKANPVCPCGCVAALCHSLWLSRQRGRSRRSSNVTSRRHDILQLFPTLFIPCKPNHPTAFFNHQQYHFQLIGSILLRRKVR